MWTAIMHENQQPQTEAFELSAAERKRLSTKCTTTKTRVRRPLKPENRSEAAWLGAGWRDPRDRDVLGIPASDVEGVATFYSQISASRLAAM